METMSDKWLYNAIQDSTGEINEIRLNIAAQNIAQTITFEILCDSPYWIFMMGIKDV